MAAAQLLASKLSGRKLRLMCLHGMYQDATTFAAKTKHLRGAHSSDFVDYLFLDGPFTIVPPILAQKSAPRTHSRSSAASSKPKRVRCAKKTTEFRSWWRPLGVHESDPRKLDDDREVLVAFLREKLDEFGHVDGVLGFSQGASLAAWMCSEQAHAELQWSPKLAVLIGSYLGEAQYSLASSIHPGIDSLHMFGSNDHVIPAAKTEEVVDIFKEAQGQVVTSIHNQGHVIPKCDSARKQFHDFLSWQHRKLCAGSDTGIDGDTLGSSPSPPSSSSSSSPSPPSSSTSDEPEHDNLAATSESSTSEQACIL